MKSPYSLTPIVLGAAAIVATPFQSAHALSATEVGAIAEAVTVRIDGQNSGSGVIIKRQGNVYTVLTAAHVVETEDGYDVVTPDDQLHELDYSKVKKLPNVDLALVEFTSPKTYKVADIGDSTAVKAGASIYVSGFPLPTTAITESIWNFSEGKVTANSKRPLADGYALVYSNDTLPGMSGGAVLNSQGKLIAIHGRADAEQSVQKTETIYQKTGFNLGIPINTFLNLAANVSPTLGFVSKVNETTGTTLTKDDWLLQGVGKYKTGNYQEAIQDFDQAIALNPKNADAYYNRGLTYNALKQYNQALQDFNRAIRINPGNVLAYYNRGVTYDALQQYDQALKDFNRGIQIDPGNALAYFNRGVTYNSLKQYNQALQDYSQAIQINPELEIAYDNRGITYYALKQYDLALKDYSRAIQINPQFALPYYNRGTAYRAIKKNYLALKDFNRAIQINPEFADAYGNRGLTYRTIGNKPKAKQDLQTAARLFQQQNKPALYQKTLDLLQRL